MFIRNLAIAAGAAFALAAPASAVHFVVGVGAVTPIPGNNDFKANLAALSPSLVDYTDVGATLSLSGAAPLKFEFVAREAGFNDTFKVMGGPSYTSPGPSFVAWPANILIGTHMQAAGPVTNWFFTPGGGPKNGVDLGIGTAEFAIFLPAGFTPGSSWISRVLYLGFDDDGAGPDDNHDDMIIRVSVIPEPGTWAMLIAGFGVIGLAMRRRARTAHVTA